MRMLSLGVAALLAFPLLAEPRTPESTAKWREDLEVFRRELPRTHENLFHTTTPEAFNRAVDELAASVPNRADHELAVGLGRIVASIDDGHTHINFGQPALGFRMLPVQFHQFRDGIYIRGIGAQHAELAGAKVLSIEGRPVDEVWSATAAVTPRDNDSGLRAMTALHLAIPEILHALGLSASKDKVTLRVQKNGRPSDVTLAPLPIMEVRRMKTVDARPDAVPAPLYALTPERNFWFRYLEGEKLLYVKYNTVYWQKKENGDYQSPGEFFNEVFTFADSHPVERLVIDVRDNGGGNNTLNLPIVHGIIRRDALNQRGRLFVITGRGTFSAAQNFVNEMAKHTNVLFAGEPTGARPNHYGDPAPVKLPNSGIEIRVSTLFWQDAHPADDRKATAPHLNVEMTAADYLAGTDPVLQAIRSFRLLPDVIREALPQGTDAVRQAYARYRDNPVYASLSTDREMNALATEVAAQNLEHALLLARLNVQTYPASGAAHHTLGTLLLQKGERAEAIREYEKALELEPRNPYRREVLEKAKAGG